MLAIKFKRIGKKHQASFRVVVAEKRSKLQGNFVEDLGSFNPHDDTMQLNKERASYWLSVGAQPTATVRNLLIKSGVIRGKKIVMHLKTKKGAALEAAKAASAEALAGAKALADKSAGKPEATATAESGVPPEAGKAE